MAAVNAAGVAARAVGDAVYRDIDDPLQITVWHDFDDRAAAESFAASEDLKTTMAEAGVEAVICPGINAASSEAVVHLADQHAILYAAVGIQPNYVIGLSRGAVNTASLADRK